MERLFCMTSSVPLGGWSQHHVEIPDHLRYRRPESPLKRALSHVTPRYMLTKEERLAMLPHHQQEEAQPSMQRFTSPLRKFRDVEPRYNLPAAASETTRKIAGEELCRIDSDTARLLRAHETVVQRRYAHVLPRYSVSPTPSCCGADEAIGGGSRSPSASRSRGNSQSFRVGPAPASAADTIRRNERLIKASRNGYQPVVQSAVAEYIRNGTPVKHASVAAAAAAAARPVLRSNSKEDKKLSFVPSGGAGGGQWQKRAKSPVSPPMVKEEAKVQRYVQNALHRQLSPGQIAPRVAYLSDAYLSMLDGPAAAVSVSVRRSQSPSSSAPPGNAREFSPPVRFHPR